MRSGRGRKRVGMVLGVAVLMLSCVRDRRTGTRSVADAHAEPTIERLLDADGQIRGLRRGQTLVFDSPDGRISLWGCQTRKMELLCDERGGSAIAVASLWNSQTIDGVDVQNIYPNINDPCDSLSKAVPELTRLFGMPDVEKHEICGHASFGAWNLSCVAWWSGDHWLVATVYPARSTDYLAFELRTNDTLHGCWSEGDRPEANLRGSSAGTGRDALRR